MCSGRSGYVTPGVSDGFQAKLIPPPAAGEALKPAGACGTDVLYKIETSLEGELSVRLALSAVTR